MMKYFDIETFGAVGDGKTINTDAIQAAVDAASEVFGTVVIPAGTFISGTINLKNADLYLENHAVLKGSPDIRDYPYIGYYHNEMKEVTSLLYAIGNNNIHVYGSGMIDFNGTSFYNITTPIIPDYYKTPLTKEQIAECNYAFDERVNQPFFFADCEKIVMDGISLNDASCWTLSFSHCKNIKLLNLNITANQNLPNNDGMHFSCCQDVIVKGCNILTGDDCIALTCITDWEGICENFVISDCILRSCSKAFVAGYMYSHVRNITLSNCIIQDSNRGICIMSGAGVGLVENVIINNVMIDTRVRVGNWWGNGEPIFLMGVQHDNGILSFIAEQKPDKTTKYCIDNVFINNVVIHGENAMGIVGDGDSIRNVTLSNISFKTKASKNLALKGRTLDTNPAPIFIDVPDDCFLKIHGADDVKLINVTGDEAACVDKVDRRRA